MSRSSLLICALLAGLARAQDLPSKMEVRDVTFPVRTLDLPSGMRIVVEQDKSRPLAAVVAVVDVGGSGDPAGKEGLAHLVEHLTFRALQDKQHAVADLLEAAGAGRWNAFTSWDVTTYFEVGSRDSLPNLLTLEGARLLRPLEGVTEEAFATEREVVKNELSQRDEQGFVSGVATRLAGSLYPKVHPYARPIIGTDASISALTLEDARAFVREHYRPERVTVVISGDVDPAGIGKLLDASFPPQFLEPGQSGPVAVKPRIPPKPAPAPDPVGSADVIRVSAPAEVPLIYIGWSLPGGYDAEGYIEAFVTRMAANATAWATARDPDLVGVGAFLLRGKQGSMLVCVGRLRVGRDPAASADRMLNQLFRLWLPGTADRTANAVRLAEAQFLQRRNQTFVAVAADLEDLAQRALARAELVHMTADPNVLTRELRSIGELTAGTLSRFAHDHLSRDRARIVYVDPEGMAGAAADRPAAFAATGGIRLSISPDAIRSRVVPPGAQLRNFRLPSGLEVVLARRVTAPIVTVTFAARGGEANGEPPGAPLYANFAWPVDTRHGIPANYGMTTSDWITRGVSFVQVRAPNGNLDNALAILLDHVRSLHLDDGVRNWIDREYRPIYRQEFERPSRAADRTLWGTVYGSHPLGRAVTPDAFDRVSSGDVQRWIDRAFTPGNSVLVVAGDLDLDKAERAARAWFEGWDPRPDGRPFGVGTLGSRTPDQPVPIVRTVKPGARQVDVELACAIPLQTPRDRIAAQLVASRMERRMHGFARKGLGSTYGIGARLTIQPAILQLSLGGSIDSRGIARILALLRSEADNLGKAAPDPEDLARTQWDEGLRASIAYESSGTMGLTLARLRLAGLPAETLEKFPDELMKTTGADVQRVAAECRKTVASLMGEQGTLDRLVPAR